MFWIVPISGDFHFSNLPTARNCLPSVRNFATLAKTMIEGYPSVFELRQNFHWNYNFENKDSKLFPCQACQRASYIFAEIPKTRFSRIICNLRTAPGLQRQYVFNSLTLLLGSQNSFLIMFQSDSPLSLDHKQM